MADADDRITELEAEVVKLRKLLEDVSKAVPNLSPTPVEPMLKADEDRRIAFGWAYVAKRPDGSQVIDYSGDRVADEARITKMENAAYRFVLDSRSGDVNHDGKPVATLIESTVFTPEKVAKMGLPGGWAPSAWWTGFRIHDDNVWERVRNGELSMFSIGGKGARKAIA